MFNVPSGTCKQMHWHHIHKQAQFIHPKPQYARCEEMLSKARYTPVLDWFPKLIFIAARANKQTSPIQIHSPTKVELSNHKFGNIYVVSKTLDLHICQKPP